MAATAPSPRRAGAAVRRALARPGGLGPWLGLPAVAVAAGIGMAVAPFLPWYATNLGQPFTPSATSGWSAGATGKAVLALGVATLLLALVLAADGAGAVGLEEGLRRGLRASLLGAAVAAVAIACYRVIVLPSPAGFFSREYGLYVALACAAAAAAVGARWAALDRAGG